MHRGARADKTVHRIGRARDRIRSVSPAPETTTTAGNGNPVRLGSRTMYILIALTERGGELAGKPSCWRVWSDRLSAYLSAALPGTAQEFCRKGTRWSARRLAAASWRAALHAAVIPAASCRSPMQCRGRQGLAPRFSLPAYVSCGLSCDESYHSVLVSSRAESRHTRSSVDG
jgi:hypothetical protein